MEEIVVSVLCTAYNHEIYIRKCLNSIVSQKTNFKFEVLVNDDASTDNTASIIREFEQKYPDLVKPVYQETNMKLQHVNIVRDCLISRARGKYLAICEGDDYWTDNAKLQTQVDLLESHPEIDMCTHAAIKTRNGETIGYVMPSAKQKIFTPDETISGGGSLFATNSIMYRKSMREHTPRFVQFMEFDYTLQVWGSLRGGILYIPKVMAAYRIGAVGSWTMTMKKNPDLYFARRQKILEMEMLLLDEVDEQYKETVEHEIEESRITILRGERNIIELFKPEHLKHIKRYPLKKKIKFAVKTILHRV